VEFDEEAVRSISELVALCVKCLNCGAERTKELLAREWKETGAGLPPSIAEEVGIEVSGWHDPSRTEAQQLHDWLVALCLRAVQLCARTGSSLGEYGQTLGLEGNPWRELRLGTDDSPAACFVRGLNEERFLALLVAWNLGSIGLDLPLRPLILPTDGDITDVNGIVTVKTKTLIQDWQEILKQNFVRRLLRLRTLSADPGAASTGEWVNTLSMPSLDWSRLLYLARCAALKEAAPAESGGPVLPTEYGSLDDLRDRIDSVSSAQMPMIDLLEKIAREFEIARVRSDTVHAPEEGLRNALGPRVYRALDNEAVNAAVTAEQIFRLTDIADPGVGVFCLCRAFELQLKRVLLVEFCRFLSGRGVSTYPDREQLPNGKARPRILANGRRNDRLSLGEIRLALESPRPELNEFCTQQGLDVVALKRAIEEVSELRNTRAHEGSISFVEARRIRERLLGIASGDGGVFGLVVSSTQS